MECRKGAHKLADFLLLVVYTTEAEMETLGLREGLSVLRTITNARNRGRIGTGGMKTSFVSDSLVVASLSHCHTSDATSARMRSVSADMMI